MLAKQCLPPLSAMLAVALVGTTVLAAPDAGSVPPTPTPASAPARSTITVRIQGLRHDRGLILVALYDNEEAFAKKSGHVAAAETPAKHGGAVVVFDAVKPGRYALAFFQDENGNKKLDTSFLGIPTEAFGFSRDAMGKRGPPAFAAAAVVIPVGPVSVVMNARHF